MLTISCGLCEVLNNNSVIFCIFIVTAEKDLTAIWAFRFNSFAIFLPAVKSGYETFYCDRFVIITSLRKANCIRWEFTC